METPIYALALSLVKYLGVRSSIELVERVGSLDAVFSLPERVLQVAPKLQRRIFSQLTDPALLREASLIYQRCKDLGIHPCCILDEDYPPLLRESVSPPFILYVRGSYEGWREHLHLSLVGTRMISDYGRQLTYQLLGELATCSIPVSIVSGLAYGVDVEAHRKALALGLPTVAVLAHGLDTVYPSLHSHTATEILDAGGALVSEYPPGAKPYRQAFVARNRIIAGLSEGTVVIEAGERSGSLSTARYAFESDREVFAFPGRISDPMSLGCHRLIQETKAHLCLGASTILSELGWEQPLTDLLQNARRAGEVAKTPPALPEHPILGLLVSQGEMQVDELARALSLDVASLATQLFDLELDGYVEALSGGRYRLAVRS